MDMRSADRKTLAWWVAGITFASLCLSWVLRAESERQMDLAAEQSGLRWAQFAIRSVPDLESVLSGQGLTGAARERLLQLRKVDDVFRFKLFDPAGRLQLVSDDLHGSAPLPVYDVADGIGHGSAASRSRIRDSVLAGGRHTQLYRESAADRPAIFSEIGRAHV